MSPCSSPMTPQTHLEPHAFEPFAHQLLLQPSKPFPVSCTAQSPVCCMTLLGCHLPNQASSDTLFSRAACLHLPLHPCTPRPLHVFYFSFCPQAASPSSTLHNFPILCVSGIYSPAAIRAPGEGLSWASVQVYVPRGYKSVWNIAGAP